MKSLFYQGLPLPLLLFFLAWVNTEAILTANSGTVGPVNAKSESVTVIDILSQNVQFSTFLRIIQKNGQVPLLNKLTNITLIAPVNSAFVDFDTRNVDFDSESLRQYVLDNSVLSSDIDGIQIAESLLETDKDTFLPVLLDHSKNGPGNERIFTIDGIEVVDADIIAYSQDAVVHGVNEMLPEKLSLCDFIAQKTSNYTATFKTFGQLLSVDYCPSLSGVTVLLPTDDTIKLNDIEISYLQTIFGKSDRKDLLNRNLFRSYIGGKLHGHEIITFKDFNNNNVEFQTFHGGNDIVIDGKKALFANLLTRNGIVHVVDVFETSSVEFTPRKYLYGLQSEDFVEQLELRKLDYLIDDNNISQTLFLHNDDDEDEKEEKTNMAPTGGMVEVTGSSVHKSLLLYHFIDGKIENRKPGLYNSKYCNNKKLGSNCQKVKILYDEKKGTATLNDDVKIDINSKISVGDTDIYFLEKDYSLPLTLKKSVTSLSRCTKSMKYLSKFNLLDLKNNEKGFTVFLPCFDSWSHLDLALDYLERNSTALELIVRNTVVNDLIYSDFKGELSTSNLNNEVVEVKELDLEYSNFKTLSINNRKVYVEENNDIIFDQGVVHPIEGVIIPPAVQITLPDLIKTADADRFIELLKFSNMSYVLHDPKYSVIIPSLDSLIKENFTIYTPKPILTSFLKLHILPNEESEQHDSIFNCGSKIPTLLESVHLSCRAFDKKSSFLQIVEGFGFEVRILKTGCSTLSNESCIFVTDRAILPEWLNTGKKIKFHLPLAALGIGFILGIIFIFIFVPCCLLFIVGNGKKETEVISDEELGNESSEQQGLLSEAQPDSDNYGATLDEANGSPTSRVNINQPIAESLSTPISVLPSHSPAVDGAF